MVKVYSFLTEAENVSKLIMAVGAQLYEYTKSHGVVHFQWVNWMLCELYHSKKCLEKSSVLTDVPSEVLRTVPETKLNAMHIC